MVRIIKFRVKVVIIRRIILLECTGVSERSVQINGSADKKICFRVAHFSLDTCDRIAAAQ